ncbi:MAG: hypothetical protein K1Y36_08490 [Blastocatellia bacterium]|nr:hypothetical protein [Blastocatellia bacterium]
MKRGFVWPWQQRPNRFQVTFLVLLAGLAAVLSAQSAKTPASPYELARACPRGACIYVQFRNLPEFLDLWNRSALRERYLQSVNFDQFQKRHLGIKLLERFDEVSLALGFPLDSRAFHGATQNQAALAVYDIGKMEMVFVAPVDEATFKASVFALNQDHFDHNELPDGSVFYTTQMAVDRDRQKQNFLFSFCKGKLVLATNTSLLLRTLANLNGKNIKDRLSDEPAFQILTGEINPHFVTSWIDQQKLNRDWYFKEYWIHPGLDKVKGVQAGIFDFEMQADRWFEHRRFLRSGMPAAGPLGMLAETEVERLRGLLPADIPYLRLQPFSLSAGAPADAVGTVFFEPVETKTTVVKKSWGGNPFGYSESWRDTWESSEEDDFSYQYLDYRYDRQIDDEAETGQSPPANFEKTKVGLEAAYRAHFAEALREARPTMQATLYSPEFLPQPLFANFRKAVVLSLKTPGAVKTERLEQAFNELIQARLALPQSSNHLQWVKQNQDGVSWVELTLPELGRKLGYAVHRNHLIFSNRIDLLKSLLLEKAPARLNPNPNGQWSEVTVVQFDQGQKILGQFFEPLETDKFFSSEVRGLLDVSREVRALTLKRRSLPGRLVEDLEIGFVSGQP